MAQRQLTDAWGDRWDATQDDHGNSDDVPPISFRHQSGRTVSAPAGATLHAMSTRDLLELLESARQRAGFDRSVVRGIDAKTDPEGYINPEGGSEPDTERPR